MTARRDSIALGLAALVNGIAAYFIVVVASRGLSDRDFASFSVGWSLWALSVALLVFPMQHWIIWRVAADNGKAAVRRAMPQILALIGIVLTLLYIAGSAERLFPVGDWWGPILVSIGATSALLGIGRGLLAANGQYERVAWVIGLENLFRGLAIVVVLLLGLAAELVVAAIAAGVMALVPFLGSVRLGSERSAEPVAVIPELGALAGATAMAQVMVQFPPALAEWLGESPSVVAGIFATFALGRAPLLVILALSARMTAPLTRGLTRPASVVRRLILRVGSVTLLAASAGGFGGYLFGPEVVSWFFGPGRALGRTDTALISSGLVVAMAGVIATLSLMAMRANGLAAIYWLVGLIASGTLALLGTGIPVSFFIGELVAVGASVIALWLLVSRSQVTSGV